MKKTSLFGILLYFANQRIYIIHWTARKLVEMFMSLVDQRLVVLKVSRLFRWDNKNCIDSCNRNIGTTDEHFRVRQFLTTQQLNNNSFQSKLIIISHKLFEVVLLQPIRSIYAGLSISYSKQYEMLTGGSRPISV